MTDKVLSSKLRQIIRELKEWSELAEKNKLSRLHIDRMKTESVELHKLLSNREL